MNKFVNFSKYIWIYLESYNIFENTVFEKTFKAINIKLLVQSHRKTVNIFFLVLHECWIANELIRNKKNRLPDYFFLTNALITFQNFNDFYFSGNVLAIQV